MRIQFLSVIASMSVMAGMVSPVAMAHQVDVSTQASVLVPGHTGVAEVIKDLHAEFRTDSRDERQTAREGVKERRADLQTQVKERLTAARTTQIKKWAAHMQRRLEDLVGRLSKSAVKIEARISALAAAGRDVTKLRADLAAARVKIAIAQTAVSSVGAQVDVIITTNTPKDALAKLHDLQKDVTTTIRQAQQALVQVLAETRGLSR